MLGLLLLRANRVVATSELLGALWPDENRPTTARKIVQNAVWGLRALFAEESAVDRGPELVTQAPGYVLRLDPEQVDLHRFNRRVAEGRAQLSGGRPAEAARLLGAALEEWHGPALADLAEAGTDWPELTALSQLRLDVMEDRFEAELRSGHHYSVLGELVSLAEEEPLRERLCGQLMLALYRCGRQAEALDVFSRVRRALVEEHGLEPSRELQLLQQNILTHDPALAPPATVAPTPPAVHTRPEQPVSPVSPAPPRAVAARGEAARAAVPERVAHRAPAPHTERRSVAVLLVGARTAETSAAGPGESHTLYDAVAAVADCVEEFGGTVAGSLGRVWVAVFGLDTDRAEAAQGAVRAAVALRARLSQVPGPRWHAVVSAGEALVRWNPYDGAAPVRVVGRLVDEARTLLATVPSGAIHLDGEAVQDTVGLVRQVPTERPRVRAVAGLRTAGEAAALPDPSGGFEAELDMVKGLLTRSRRHDAPHLVTILGEPGVGRTRFLADFVRSIQGEAVRVVRVRGGDRASWTLCDVLRACCGLPLSDTDDRGLTDVVHRVAGRSETAERLLRRLSPGRPHDASDQEAEAYEAWCELLVLLAREQPLVLCVDDAHAADDAVLGLVEKLASLPQDVPLLILVCARPGGLLARRPLWGSGLRHSVTLTLQRLPGAAAEVWAERPEGARGTARPATTAPQRVDGR
ncbi:BTAD domain-containing putative transcriptional regulator [Streptomyces diastatochromogenes]|uniref:OmpR/PhoB-type domain-containing protein n=1 Tax=Streptomyces diastatochromogenes TaxID=42236 RepID=A0A233RX93_STRDA|nr:BTAD domain-containing putative transcriptional regulator [Streptomyces diastatochromogenes]OXY88027.1 hypothetical protein BEK98_43030 [Streptomyces diastatochromogenes]